MIRIRSLDVFRGVTIFLMILVNSPGLSVAYEPLIHANGDGCTLADWVFPFFLVILGASSVLTHSSIGHILKRSVIIFMLGLFLNACPNHWQLSLLRIPGVLQRISICYLFSALMSRYTQWKTQICWMLGLLIGYAFLIVIAGTEVIGAFDEKILTSAHLYQPHFDPEGLLSTIPALASTLCGHILGIIFLQNLSKIEERSQILCLGLMFCSLGWLWQYFWPLNKSIWSSSYALWTAGLAYLVWFFCDVLCAWLYPFEVLGRYALWIYVLHVLGLKIQMWIQMSVDGHVYHFKTYVTQLCFGGMAPLNASLAYAISYCFLWMFVAFSIQWFQKKDGKYGFSR
jgi:predicted acyltransferase